MRAFAARTRQTKLNNDPNHSSLGKAVSTREIPPILSLQRKIGNRAVRHLLNRHSAAVPSAADGPQNDSSRAYSLPETPAPIQTNTTGLPAQVLAKMENVFGKTFSDVKIHPDDRRVAETGALALTQGTHVRFAPAQYNPHTREGQALLGHELTHVLQQRRGTVEPEPHGPSLTKKADDGFVLDTHSALEQEAEQNGMRATEGQPVSVKERCRAQSGDVTQAKMGFEFQGVNLIEKEKTSGWVPIKRGESKSKPIYEGKNGVKLETDTGGEFEFVTSPYAKWSELAEEIQEAVNVTKEIKQKYDEEGSDNIVELPQKGQSDGWNYQQARMVFSPLDSRKFYAAVQSTEGVRLEDIPSLMEERLGPGGAGEIEHTARTVHGWSYEPDVFWYALDMDPQVDGFMRMVIHYIMEASASYVPYVDLYGRGALEEPWLKFETLPLTHPAVSAFMDENILEAKPDVEHLDEILPKRPPEARFVKFKPNTTVKGAFTLMTRTDFASLYASMDEKNRDEVKRLFRYGPDKGTTIPDDSDHPITIATGKDMSTPVFPAGYWVEKSEKYKYLAAAGTVSIGEWLHSIVKQGEKKRKKKKWTIQQIGKGKNKYRDKLSSPPETGGASMGSLGMDENLAVIEMRGYPALIRDNPKAFEQYDPFVPKGGIGGIPAEKWLAFAHDVFCSAAHLRSDSGLEDDSGVKCEPWYRNLPDWEPDEP